MCKSVIVFKKMQEERFISLYIGCMHFSVVPFSLIFCHSTPHLFFLSPLDISNKTEVVPQLLMYIFYNLLCK